VKHSDLFGAGNWSAEYNVNKKKGKNPYEKKDDIMVEVGKKASIPKNVVYLTPVQAEKYNKLAKELIRIKKEQEDVMNDLENIIK